MNDQKILDLVAQATHFSTHSGEVGPGGIFVALKGEARDGHDFVPALLAKGILAAVVEKDMGDARALLVKNSHEAHVKIAGLFRDKFKGPVIGVGGSSGKTSTKELLYKVLSTKYACVKTDKSQNGLLGIPKTLEKLRPGVEIAIVEIGIDAPHEMIRHVSLVKPTHALLTSIGEEHLLLLKDIEGVFREERILLDETIKRGGYTYCPMNDPYLAKLTEPEPVPATPMELDPPITVGAHDKHTLQNMALVSAVALDLGMSPEEISAALADAEILDGRGLKWKISEKLWVVRDHYNANPSSMLVALEAAQKFAQEKGLPLKLIVGEMRELGDLSLKYHEQIVERVRTLGAQQIMWVGGDMQKAAGTLRAHESSLANSTLPLTDAITAEFKGPGVVLIKGSRGTELEKIMDRLYGLHTTAKH